MISNDIFYSLLFPSMRLFTVLGMASLLGLSSALHTNQTFVQSLVAGTVMGLITCLHSAFGTGLAMGQIVSYMFLNKSGWWVLYNLTGFLAGFVTMLWEGDSILIDSYINIKSKYRRYKVE